MSDLTAVNLEPGEVVGGYTLISRLGSGAMGSVWRVRDDGGQIYAMKILRDSLADDGATAPGGAASGNGPETAESRRPVRDPNLKEHVTPRERLRREALALRKVDHPGVCGIVDMELDDALAFIVTELIEGRNLKDDVAVNGRYAGDDLERLARKLIEAVKAVHAAGIVHRDIKPTNVMVSASGPVLVDFGIAMGEGESHVTRTGLVMGTPGFIAPEIIDGAESSEATDWWSVASVLAFAAMGEPVFGTKPMMAVLEREASGNANLAGLPAHTLAAFRSALAPDPAKRCTPDQLLHAIALDALASVTGDETLPDDGSPTDDATEVVRPFDMPRTIRSSGATGATDSAPHGDGSDATDATTTSARDAWRDIDDGDGRDDATRALAPEQCTVALPSDRLGPDAATVALGAETPERTTVLPERTTALPDKTSVLPVAPEGPTGGLSGTGREPLQRLADATNRTAASLPPAYVPPVPRSARGGGGRDARGDGTVPEFLRDETQEEATRTLLQPPAPPTAQYAMPGAATPQPYQQTPIPQPYQPYQPYQQGQAPQVPQPNPADLRRARYLRHGVLPLVLMAVIPAAAALADPLAGPAAAAALLWLLNTAGHSTASQLDRESRRGGVAKGSDVALRIVQLPWHLLRALPAALGRTIQFTLIDVGLVAAVAAALPLPWTMTPVPGGYWPYELPWLTDGPLSTTGVTLAGAGAVAWILASLWPPAAMLRLAAGSLRR